jgi:hypothetical protein
MIRDEEKREGCMDGLAVSPYNLRSVLTYLESISCKNNNTVFMCETIIYPITSDFPSPHIAADSCGSQRKDSINENHCIP